MIIRPQKPGETVEFHHHDGDFKWYRRQAALHSKSAVYILVKDESAPGGLLQVESALIIAPEKKRERSSSNKEDLLV